MQNDLSLSAGRIRFGDFEVDVESHELLRLGRRIRLQEKSFLVLNELLKRPGQVVTREELAAALWPKEYFVDAEHGLNTAVRRLREALGDSADDARYVETLPKLGYRFVGAIEKAGRPVAAPDAAASIPAPAMPAAVEVAASPPRSSRRGAFAGAATLVAVALAVFATLLVRSRSSAPAGATSPPPASTGNAAVSELLARSRYLRNHKRLDEARRFVEEALRLEPTNPEALAGRALSYLADQEYDKARETARRALELDPKAWEAHRALGNLATRAGDFAGAELHYRNAVESNPTDYKTRNRFGRHLLGIGRLEEAKAQIQESRRLAPDDPDVQNIWIQYALLTGDYESAVREAEIWLSIWENQLAGLSAGAVREMLAWAYLGARRHDEAIAQFRVIDPEDESCVALALGYAGRIDEARKLLDALQATATASDSPRDPYVAERIASTCVVIGDFDCAFAYLDRQIAARSYPAWLHYPFFHPIRQDARWPALMKRLEVEFFSGKEETIVPGRPELFIRSARIGTDPEPRRQ